MYNSVMAVAGIGGSVLGGLVAAKLGGYGSVPWLAVLGVMLGLVLSLRGRR